MVENDIYYSLVLMTLRKVRSTRDDGGDTNMTSST
jgi:hypothetical protein